MIELKMVNEYIKEFLLSENPDFIDNIISEILDTPGKQIRPMMLLVAAQFGNLNLLNQEICFKVAAIIEMIHTASLVHDDIVDNSASRRGKPTIQAKYGKDIALYLGDFILSRILLETSYMPEYSNRFAHVIESMCRGEVLQNLNKYNDDIDENTYFKIIYNKTAVLIKTSFELGALVSNCDIETYQTLSLIGENMGYMFQLLDDLMDFLDENGQDVKEGIFTLPYLHQDGVNYTESMIAEYRLSTLSLIEELPNIPARQTLILILNMITK